MPFRIATDVKSRLDNPFNEKGLLVRPIIVLAGAVWPTGDGSDYLIPVGTPMCPVKSTTTGKYKPIRRSSVAATVGSASTVMTLDSVDGFATGDVVNILAANPTLTLVTVGTVGTIAAVDYVNETIGLSAALMYTANIDIFVEVAENGAHTNISDAVFLGENVQTRDELAGTSVDSPARGLIGGQVRVGLLATNCYDALTPRQIPGFDYIPTQPGLA